MTITLTDWLGVLIIVLQAAIAITQYLLNRQSKAILAEIRAMRPTIKGM